MQKELVNRIYWAPEYSNAFTLGASGSQVTIEPDGSVHQHNDLMAPGDLIMYWHSHDNYQASKTVPQLPILQQGDHYRIVLHSSSFPAKTVIYRLDFLDLQGHIFESKYFREQEYEFEYPVKAVNYEVKVINAGNTDFYFDNLEISSAKAPSEANSNFWIQNPVGNAENEKLILLIPAGRSFKTNFPELKRYSKDYNILPIVVGRITPDELKKYLRRLTTNAALANAKIVSCGPRLNDGVIDFAQSTLDHQFMIFVNYRYDNLPDNVQAIWQQNLLPMIKPDAYEPDWATIFTFIQQN